MNRRPDPAEWTAAADRLELKRKGGELVGPCPACGGHDRFHVHWRGSRSGVFACRHGCGFRSILEAAGLWRPAQGPEKPAGRRNRSPARSPTRTATARQRSPDGANPATHGPDVSGGARRAAQLWARTEPDPGTISRYLAGRGVWPPDRVLPDTVRWLPGPELEAIRWREPPGPDAAGAMACLYATPAGAVSAVSLEALRDDGTLTGERWRRTIGIRGRSLFRVAGPGDLALCEGEADALAVRTWCGCEAWAAGGTAGMADLAPALAADSRAVTVHADGDAAGRRAATLLAVALRARGITVTMARSPDNADPAADLADAWRERVSILEVDAGMTRGDAEREAWKLVESRRNRGGVPPRPVPEPEPDKEARSHVR